VTSGYGQLTSGYWLAVVIGAVELLMLVTYTTAAARTASTPRRQHPDPPSGDPPSGDPPSGDPTNRPGKPMIRSYGVEG
jgi:hypothetical protein